MGACKCKGGWGWGGGGGLCVCAPQLDVNKKQVTHNPGANVVCPSAPITPQHVTRRSEAFQEGRRLDSESAYSNQGLQSASKM